MAVIWVISSVLIAITWAGILDIEALNTYREYEATGTGCLTLGVWYEIMVAMPWVPFPCLVLIFHRRHDGGQEFKLVLPLCSLLLFADVWHVKLHITGFPMDVYLTSVGYLLSFGYCLHIYVERSVQCISRRMKLLIFATLAFAIFFTLGIPAYFSFSLISVLLAAVFSDRIKLQYCVCALIFIPAIIAMVYVEAVHCDDFRNVFGFDAHFFTDIFGQCIVLLGVIIVWETANDTMNNWPTG